MYIQHTVRTHISTGLQKRTEQYLGKSLPNFYYLGTVEKGVYACKMKKKSN